jgi:FkbM family methyltransferase
MLASEAEQPERPRRIRKARRQFLEVARHFVPYLIGERDGLLLVLPTDDPSLRTFFERGGEAEQTILTRAMECLDGAGIAVSRSTLVNIGANVGTATLAALQAGFSSVIACEPVTSTFRLLRANLALNGVENSVRTLEVALSNRAGTAVLDLQRGSGKARLLARPGESPQGRSQKVRVTTLDDLVAEGVLDPAAVGLLFIDVEGHELHVLEGADSVLHAGVPLIMELNPKLLRLAGKIDELAGVLARHYTHLVDLRTPSDPALLPLDRLGALIEQYENGCTDILGCRLSA